MRVILQTVRGNSVIKTKWKILWRKVTGVNAWCTCSYHGMYTGVIMTLIIKLEQTQEARLDDVVMPFN